MSDKGDLLYKFEKENNNAWWGIIFSFITFSIIAYFIVSKLDFDSFYIYEKYYTSPFQLFSFDYTFSLERQLLKSNSVELDSFRSFNDFTEEIPTLLALVLTGLSELIFKFYKDGIYTNGIIVTKQFHSLNVIRSYEFVEQNDKTNLKLVLNQTGMFSNDYKEVEILINDDEINEIKTYLRHEVQAFSKVENLKEIS
tara:strand:+ start:328 stop:918 length:591 start_codon:yes stop_codon:yes gene_type:complete